MHTTTLHTSILLAALLTLFATLIPSVSGVCCPRASLSGQCPDCSIQSGRFCCAVGNCNIFCCNCDIGCRNAGPGTCSVAAASGLETRDVEAEDDSASRDCNALAKTADENNDGVIDEHEWAGFVNSQHGGEARWLARFKDFDPTNRGYITMSEAMAPQPDAKAT